MQDQPNRDRRRFLKGMAAGAALAPLGSLGYQWAFANENSQVASLCTAAGQLSLTRDLTYRGLFRYPVPDGNNIWLGFSDGAMTGRRVGNNIQLLVAGSSPIRTVNGAPVQDPIYEITYPGVGSNLATAPRADLVRVWGDVYKGRRIVQSGSNTSIRGLLWANDRLLWAYGDVYNTAGLHDCSIGTSFLNNDGTVTTYGPWRTTAHSQKTRGYMVQNPATGQIGYGGPITSGNASSAWGLTVNLGNIPDPSIASDETNLSRRSIGTSPFIDHSMDRPQRRFDTNYKVCGWNVQYDNAAGGFTRPGGDGFCSIDMISAAAWVRTSSKEGIVCFGQMAQTIPGFQYGGGDTVTHLWYGPSTCVHGQDGRPVSVSTGDASGTSVLNAWVFDPSNPSNDPFPVPLRNLMPQHNRAGGLYTFGGAWFDAPSRLLFVSESGADGLTNSFEGQPVVHVFEVAN